MNLVLKSSQIDNSIGILSLNMPKPFAFCYNLILALIQTDGRKIDLKKALRYDLRVFIFIAFFRKEYNI